MYSILQPIDLVLIVIAGWMNERQRLINAYLMEENRVQRELFGTKRLRLTDDQRRRLAVKGKALGRKLLREVACIVTPVPGENSVLPIVQRLAVGRHGENSS